MCNIQNRYKQKGGLKVDEDLDLDKKKKWWTWKKVALVGAGVGFFMLVVAFVNRDKEPSNDTDVSAEMEISDVDEEQARLIEEYGEAPNGFKWEVDGSLVAKGAEELSAEDVAYAYVRALSILDFSTVEKYSSDSTVSKSYSEFYDNSGVFDNYDSFIRKMYKDALMSIQIEGVANTAVFADGKTIVSFNVSLLDLSDKDFWKKDKNSIYKKLNECFNGEDDSAKAEKYIHDYILSYYESGKAKRKATRVDIVLEKGSDGYLVTNDAEIDSLCNYGLGSSVVDYIINCYTENEQNATN